MYSIPVMRALMPRLIATARTRPISIAIRAKTTTKILNFTPQSKTIPQSRFENRHPIQTIPQKAKRMIIPLRSRPFSNNTNTNTSLQSQAHSSSFNSNDNVIHIPVDVNDPKLFTSGEWGWGKCIFAALATIFAGSGITIGVLIYLQRVAETLANDLVLENNFSKIFLGHIDHNQMPLDPMALSKFAETEGWNELLLSLDNNEPDKQSHLCTKHNALLQQLYINHRLLLAAVYTMDYIAQIDPIFLENPHYSHIDVWNPVTYSIEPSSPRRDLLDACDELDEFVKGWGPQGGLILRWFTQPISDLKKESMESTLNIKQTILKEFFQGYGADRNKYITTLTSTNNDVKTIPNAPDDFDLLLTSMLAACVSANTILKNNLKFLQHHILYTQSIVHDDTYQQLLCDPPENYTVINPSSRSKKAIPDFKHLYSHLYDHVDPSNDQKMKDKEKFGNIIELPEYSGSVASLYSILLHTIPSYRTPKKLPKAHCLEEEFSAALMLPNQKHVNRGAKVDFEEKFEQLSEIYHQFNTVARMILQKDDVLIDCPESSLDQILQYKRRELPDQPQLYLRLPILSKNELQSLHPPYSPLQVIDIERLPLLPLEHTSAHPLQKTLLSRLAPPKTCDPYALTPYQTAAHPQRDDAALAFGFMDICSVNYQAPRNSFDLGKFPLSFLFYEYQKENNNKFPTKIVNTVNIIPCQESQILSPEEQIKY